MRRKRTSTFEKLREFKRETGLSTDSVACFPHQHRHGCLLNGPGEKDGTPLIVEGNFESDENVRIESCEGVGV